MMEIGTEKEFTGSVDCLKKMLAETGSLKSLFQGIGPYLAYNTVVALGCSAVYTLTSTIGFGTTLTPLSTFIAYPLNTIWARMLLDASRPEKKF